MRRGASGHKEHLKAQRRETRAGSNITNLVWQYSSALRVGSLRLRHVTTEDRRDRGLRSGVLARLRAVTSAPAIRRVGCRYLRCHCAEGNNQPSQARHVTAISSRGFDFKPPLPPLEFETDLCGSKIGMQLS